MIFIFVELLKRLYLYLLPVVSQLDTLGQSLGRCGMQSYLVRQVCEYGSTWCYAAGYGAGILDIEM